MFPKYFVSLNNLAIAQFPVLLSVKSLISSFISASVHSLYSSSSNGSTEATQEVNVEYDNLFKVLKDRHEHKTEQASDTEKKVMII